MFKKIQQIVAQSSNKISIFPTIYLSVETSPTKHLCTREKKGKVINRILPCLESKPKRYIDHMVLFYRTKPLFCQYFWQHLSKTEIFLAPLHTSLTWISWTEPVIFCTQRMYPTPEQHVHFLTVFFFLFFFCSAEQCTLEVIKCLLYEFSSECLGGCSQDTSIWQNRTTQLLEC